MLLILNILPPNHALNCKPGTSEGLAMPAQRAVMPVRRNKHPRPVGRHVPCSRYQNLVADVFSSRGFVGEYRLGKRPSHLAQLHHRVKKHPRPVAHRPP